jgi:hypothetical protein
MKSRHMLMVVSFLFTASPAFAGGGVGVVPPIKEPKPIPVRIDLSCPQDGYVIPLTVKAQNASPDTVVTPDTWPPSRVRSCMFEAYSRAGFLNIHAVVGSFCFISHFATSIAPTGMRVLFGECSPQYWTGPEPVRPPKN